jgi:small subunit ribosomal protein S18
MAPRHGGRKVCYCTSNNITHIDYKIDYKDVDLLKKSISE